MRLRACAWQANAEKGSWQKSVKERQREERGGAAQRAPIKCYTVVEFSAAKTKTRIAARSSHTLTYIAGIYMINKDFDIRSIGIGRD